MTTTLSFIKWHPIQLPAREVIDVYIWMVSDGVVDVTKVTEVRYYTEANCESYEKE